MFPSTAVSTVVGIGGAVGALGGAVFTWIVKPYFSLHPLLVFALAACAYLVALAIFQLLVPRLGEPNTRRHAHDQPPSPPCYPSRTPNLRPPNQGAVSRVKKEILKENHDETTTHSQLTMQVVDHVRALISSGELKPGDRLPPERELARKLKISRSSLRAGIGFLSAMGVLKSRHGAGTFVSSGPPALDSSSLSVLGALHGFLPWQMFEARLVLEANVAALAAERATGEHIAELAEEVAEMYASLDDPQEYLIHDVRFHRTIARAAGNPILAALMETITANLYDTRRITVAARAGPERVRRDAPRDLPRHPLPQPVPGPPDHGAATSTSPAWPRPPKPPKPATTLRPPSPSPTSADPAPSADPTTTAPASTLPSSPLHEAAPAAIRRRTAGTTARPNNRPATRLNGPAHS